MPHNFWIATKEIDEISSSQRVMEFINLPDSPIVSLCSTFVVYVLYCAFLFGAKFSLLSGKRNFPREQMTQMKRDHQDLVDSSKKYLGETVFATFCYSSYCCCFKDFVYALRSVKFLRRGQNYISTTRI